MPVSDGPGDGQPVDPWKPIDAEPVDEPTGPVYFPLDGTRAAPQPEREREPIIPPGLPTPPIGNPGGAPAKPVFVRPGESPQDRVAAAQGLTDPDFTGRPWPWYVGPLALVMAFIGVGIVSVVAVEIVAAFSSNLSTLEITDKYEHWFGIGQDVFWILIALVTPFLFTMYLRPGQLGLRRPPTWGKAIGIFFAVFVVFYATTFIYAEVFGLNDKSNSLLDTDSGFGDTVVRDVAFALLYTVLAPVAEELLFRGVLFRTIRDGFRRRTGRSAPWLAALLSGVIFGGIHYSPAAANQNNFLPVLMALGFLLAIAYNFSGTIYVNIALHSINNAIATGSNTHPTHDWVYVLIGVGPLIAMAFTFLLSRLVRVVFPSEPRNSAHPPSAEPAIV